MKHLNLATAAMAGAAAMAMAAMTTPASADQSVVQYPGACKQWHPNANCLNHGPGNPRRYYGYVSPSFYNYGGAGYPRQSYAYYPAYQTGFAPLDFAGGVAGAAIGTAGAIATAPFRSYAWDHGPGYY
ncbi:hypothetical protein EDE08_109307 [Bradyrhizobium sp. R2.2-H]|jgi:hypothetical protein|uniref:hypothetical protein n=1 Tax=unclassified Bradyrhizobium TaxID=2631580 RepID=UPI001044E932|nr:MULTISPECIES: hypothetical protein [unclassified Bradyrhizobium]TCU68292.1 hypothetical protein EDE10_109106 [Bradyrhizobium sp. Y-H1]TCU70086.1 hypothetical protein EDE08_109307 [Bradyrhizobium sp. R2.2-H]